MKSILKILPIIMLIFFLSGCESARQEDFAFYDDFLETELKYFDQYFVFFEDKDNGITIYGVRDEEITDETGQEFINYIIKREYSGDGVYRFKCDYNVLDSGALRNDNMSVIEVIPGEEVYDYCLDDIFTIILPDGSVESREIYRDVNHQDITWLDVDDLDSRNTVDYFVNNYLLFVTIIGVMVVSISIFIGYKIYYQRNYNNFAKGKTVRKLPSVVFIGITLFIITVIFNMVVITEYNDFEYNQSNNIFDYAVSERRTSYLEPFINDGYTLLEKRGRLEAYVNVISQDQVEYLIVLVDGEDKYIADEIFYGYPGAANFDSYRVELYEKDGVVGGYIFGVIIAGYKVIDSVSTEVFAYSVGITEKVDNETQFVDFNDSIDDWTEFIKNRKGYYQVNIIRNLELHYMQ
jgi:hypothetical protein